MPGRTPDRLIFNRPAEQFAKHPFANQFKSAVERIAQEVQQHGLQTRISLTLPYALREFSTDLARIFTPGGYYKYRTAIVLLGDAIAMRPPSRVNAGVKILHDEQLPIPLLSQEVQGGKRVLLVTVNREQDQQTLRLPDGIMWINVQQDPAGEPKNHPPYYKSSLMRRIEAMYNAYDGILPGDPRYLEIHEILAANYRSEAGPQGLLRLREVLTNRGIRNRDGAQFLLPSLLILVRKCNIPRIPPGELTPRRKKNYEAYEDAKRAEMYAALEIDPADDRAQEKVLEELTPYFRDPAVSLEDLMYLLNVGRETIHYWQELSGIKRNSQDFSVGITRRSMKAIRIYREPVRRAFNDGYFEKRKAEIVARNDQYVKPAVAKLNEVESILRERFMDHDPASQETHLVNIARRRGVSKQAIEAKIRADLIRIMERYGSAPTENPSSS